MFAQQSFAVAIRAIHPLSYSAMSIDVHKHTKSIDPRESDACRTQCTQRFVAWWRCLPVIKALHLSYNTLLDHVACQFTCLALSHYNVWLWSFDSEKDHS